MGEGYASQVATRPLAPTSSTSDVACRNGIWRCYRPQLTGSHGGWTASSMKRTPSVGSMTNAAVSTALIHMGKRTAAPGASDEEPELRIHALRHPTGGPTHRRERLHDHACHSSNFCPRIRPCLSGGKPTTRLTHSCKLTHVAFFASGETPGDPGHRVDRRGEARKRGVGGGPPVRDGAPDGTAWRLWAPCLGLRGGFEKAVNELSGLTLDILFFYRRKPGLGVIV
ncbi:hypothetical protein VUR80DRAFT_7587 [Thermomyces stellatus]